MSLPRQTKAVAAVVLACEAIGLILLIVFALHFAPLVQGLATQVMEVCTA